METTQTNARPGWDSAAWNEWKVGLPKGIYYARLPRQRVWENTLDIILNGGYVTSEGKAVDIEGADSMLQGTKVYQDAYDMSACPEQGTTLTWVENGDCLFLGKKLIEKGYKPAVLNYSSQQKACGDIDKGVKGQEQDILRRTNLAQAQAQFFTTKWSDMLHVENKGNAYPLDDENGCMYTPGVTVFRLPEFFRYELLDEPFRLDIISCGAVKRVEGEKPEAEYDELTRKRMRAIFRAGLANGNDALVLGGWGCGAHNNSPETIANLFHEVMNEPEFKGRYRAVVFACAAQPTRNEPLGRFAPFGRLFGMASER